jgi:hypothetical protein
MFIVHGVATIDDADAGLQPMRTRAPSAARSIFGLRFLLLLIHVNAGFVSVLSRYACRTPAQQAFRRTVQCRRTAACKGASGRTLVRVGDGAGCCSDEIEEGRHPGLHPDAFRYTQN